MKTTEYVNQLQEDGEVKTMRVVRTFPNSAGVNTKPIKIEVLPLRLVDINGDYIVK